LDGKSHLGEARRGVLLYLKYTDMRRLKTGLRSEK